MSLKDALSIGASGLSAQRTRMETVASNLVNAKTTRGVDGEPFRRLLPIFESYGVGDSNFQGVRVVDVYESDKAPIANFEPGHPDADAAGLVYYPDINPVEEMLDMMTAARSYEANVTLLQGVREMLQATLDIVR